MRKYLFGLAVLACLVQAGDSFAAACSLKSWSSGETIKAADLNSNFTCINSGAVGLGTNATNTHIDTSAAIAHSKFATPALVPKAFAVVTPGTDCSASPCTLSASSRITSITRSGAGTYSVMLAYTAANSVYGVNVSVHEADMMCYTNTFTTTTFALVCRETDGTPAAADSSFTITVMDNDN